MADEQTTKDLQSQFKIALIAKCKERDQEFLGFDELWFDDDNGYQIQISELKP